MFKDLCEFLPKQCCEKGPVKTLYKLTNVRDNTSAGTVTCNWGVGVTHKPTNTSNGGLCSDQYIHAYKDPYLGILMDPIHAKYSLRRPFKVWRGVGIVGADDGTKIGCTQFKTIEDITDTIQLHLPTRVYKRIVARIAILCLPHHLKKYEEKVFRFLRLWIYNKERDSKKAGELMDKLNLLDEFGVYHPVYRGFVVLQSFSRDMIKVETARCINSTVNKEGFNRLTKPENLIRDVMKDENQLIAREEQEATSLPLKFKQGVDLDRRT